jgi:hypothetical protein
VSLDSPLQLSSDRDSDSTPGAVLESIKRMTRAALYARVSADKQRLEGTVPIRLAQTHTICGGGDPKNQGFKEL